MKDLRNQRNVKVEKLQFFGGEENGNTKELTESDFTGTWLLLEHTGWSLYWQVKADQKRQVRARLLLLSFFLFCVQQNLRFWNISWNTRPCFVRNFSHRTRSIGWNGVTWSVPNQWIVENERKERDTLEFFENVPRARAPKFELQMAADENFSVTSTGVVRH